MQATRRTGYRSSRQWSLLSTLTGPSLPGSLPSSLTTAACLAQWSGALFQVRWTAGDYTWIDYKRLKGLPALSEYLEALEASSIDNLPFAQPLNAPGVSASSASIRLVTADDDIVSKLVADEGWSDTSLVNNLPSRIIAFNTALTYSTCPLTTPLP